MKKFFKVLLKVLVILAAIIGVSVIVLLLIPDEMLENTDIRKISKVEVEGFILNNEEEYEL